MPRRSYGPVKQKRARCLLETLLDYADNLLEVSEQLRRELKASWTNDESTLFVVGTLEYLAELTKAGNYPEPLKKNHVEDALTFLEKYLGILKQATQQGSAERKLTLSLCSRDKAKNLERFDKECQVKDSKKVTQPGRSLTAIPTPKPQSLTPYPSPDSQPSALVEVELPDGQVPLDSAFYVERPPIESQCYDEISQPGALIRIKAPRQTGKTSLMTRILAHAEKQGYRTVRLNLRQAEGAVLTNLDKFLRWFCANISRQLQLQPQLDDYWYKKLFGSKVSCTNYFQVYLLEKIDSPIALALDEVDWVFQYPEITEEFFSLLREWYEEAKNLEIWQRLRIVVVHSTEVYMPLNINTSPFNVGLSVELPDFSPLQVQDLARRYELDWASCQVEQIMAMLGGHPYLIRVAFYRIKRQDVTFEELLQAAPTEAGIYGDHLRRYLVSLQNNLELRTAFKNVVTSDSSVQLEPMQVYQLERMGLVQVHGNDITPRCNLYRQYFRDRLRVS